MGRPNVTATPSMPYEETHKNTFIYNKRLLNNRSSPRRDGELTESIFNMRGLGLDKVGPILWRVSIFHIMVMFLVSHTDQTIIRGRRGL